MLYFLLLCLCVQHIMLTCSEQPITLFCHGIVDNQSQSQRYLNALQEPYEAFNFPDAQQPTGLNLNTLIFQACNLFGKPVNREQMYMGQGQDIETLKSHIDLDKQYIIYGVSRGGATAISLMGTYNFTNIQALIIDAAPADMITTINDIQYTLGIKFALNRKDQEYIFNLLFPAYPLYSTPAYKSIEKIQNKNLPILIVHAHTDTRVSISSAWQLYTTFLEHGFNHVYLLELNHGKHAYYMQGQDKEKYLQGLHSFYKEYNFNHNSDYATLENLSSLQPNLQTISYKLSHYKDDQITQYQNQQKNLEIILYSTVALIATYLLYTQKI